MHPALVHALIALVPVLLAAVAVGLFMVLDEYEHKMGTTLGVAITLCALALIITALYAFVVFTIPRMCLLSHALNL